MKRFNEFCSEMADRVFSSIVTAYVFFAFSLVPLVIPAIMPQILYASNCVQLVALPLLGVAGAVQSRASARLLRETHDAAMEELRDLRELLAAQPKDDCNGASDKA